MVISASVVKPEMTVTPPGPPPMVGVYTSTPPVRRAISVVRIAEFMDSKSTGATVVIVSSAIPAATFAAFRRNCDFWTVVNAVIPVNVAPTINVFDKFVALVIVVFERFTLDKSTSVRSAAARLHAGPTMKPPRSWKFVGRVTADAAAGETICPELIPAMVAPANVAPEISAAVRVAFVRFVLVKLALAIVVLERLTDVRFLFERLTLGPTMNPPRMV